MWIETELEAYQLWHEDLLFNFMVVRLPLRPEQVSVLSTKNTRESKRTDFYWVNSPCFTHRSRFHLCTVMSDSICVDFNSHQRALLLPRTQSLPWDKLQQKQYGIMVNLIPWTCTSFLTSISKLSAGTSGCWTCISGLKGAEPPLAPPGSSIRITAGFRT